MVQDFVHPQIVLVWVLFDRGGGSKNPPIGDKPVAQSYDSLTAVR